jgi:hypothetical protein
MGKRQRVVRVIEQWCGGRPERGSDKLRALWERFGPKGVPFDDEGAELLIRALDDEFGDHRLRPVDVLELDVNALVNAIPDKLATVSAAGDAAAAAAPRELSAVLVELTDDTIERLAARIAALVKEKGAARRGTTSKTRSASISKSGRRKQR